MARALAVARQETADVQDCIAFADAGLALAGHVITDQYIRELMVKVARGELTDDQAVVAMRRHVQG